MQSDHILEKHMRVALISFTHSYNYGANFQAYALEKYIEDSCTDVKCCYICYSRDFISASFHWLWQKVSSVISRKDNNPSWSIKEYVKVVFQRSGEGLNVETKAQFKKFWNLMSYDFNNKKPYRKKDLIELNKRYDLFFSGSDQIWNCGRLYLDSTYMLDFVSNDLKKFSYAPSLGMHSIPDKYYLAYKKYLSSFKELSCREKEGADIISALTGRKVEHVLDPVFLLNSNEWSDLARQSDLSNESLYKKKYILVYTLSNDKGFISSIKTYSDIAKKEVLVINDTNCNGRSTGPFEWLYLFSHADEIFTDSFHGTAFSIIFNKQFMSYIPEDSFFQDSRSRITDLLSKLGLQSRIISDLSCITENEKIDYNEVNSKLACLITQSKGYLDRCLRK